MIDRMVADARRAVDEAIAADLGARVAQMTEGWMELFAGGEFDSELIVGDIRKVGQAWTYTSGATEAQQEQLDGLNDDLERARTKLWELNQGIGVQGDDAEDTAKKIADLSAEIANYERVIGEVQDSIIPQTTSGTFGLDLDDQAIFNQFINMLGTEGGATAQQLSDIAFGLGLVGEKGAEAMVKVAALDAVMKGLVLQLGTGQIDASALPDAIRGVIALLEQDKSLGEIQLDLQVKADKARVQGEREWQGFRDELGNIPEGAVDVTADMTPAETALFQFLNGAEADSAALPFAADMQQAGRDVSDFVTDVTGETYELKFKAVIDAPSGNPLPGLPPGANPPFQTGGYVPGGRGQPVVIRAHAGEFVMRPEAVDRLGVGFLAALNEGRASSAANNVTVQTNFYAPVGTQEARQVVVRAGDDAARELLDAVRRAGYSG
jgi:hypothetical protein